MASSTAPSRSRSAITSELLRGSSAINEEAIQDGTTIHSASLPQEDTIMNDEGGHLKRTHHDTEFIEAAKQVEKRSHPRQILDDPFLDPDL